MVYGLLVGWCADDEDRLTEGALWRRNLNGRSPVERLTVGCGAGALYVVSFWSIINVSVSTSVEKKCYILLMEDVFAMAIDALVLETRWTLGAKESSDSLFDATLANNTEQTAFRANFLKPSTLVEKNVTFMEDVFVLATNTLSLDLWWQIP